MDSLTQIIVGSSVAELVGGKKYGNKAPLRGAILGTVPDLDVFINPLIYSDPIRAEMAHRGVSHSILFWFVAAPIFGRLISRIHGKSKHDRWIRTIISFLAFSTHTLVDTMTGYGTQLLAPFSDYPFTTDNIFIVDPLYTIPFMVLLIIAITFKKGDKKRQLFNWAALGVSCLYLLFSFVMKGSASYHFSNELERQGISYSNLYTGPELFTTFLWRGRAEDEKNWYYGRWGGKGVFGGNDFAIRTVEKNMHLLDPYLGDAYFDMFMRRRKGNVIVREHNAGGVVIYPAQFGILFGRLENQENHLFGFYVHRNSKTGDIELFQLPMSGDSLPDGAFSKLLERVF